MIKSKEKRGVEEKSFGVGIITFISFLIGSAGLTALLGWLIQWMAGLKQKRVSFKPLFVILAHGFGPLALSSFLGFVYVALSQGQTGDFTVGPLLIFPTQTSSTLWGLLLRRIDFFEVWGLWLTASGLIKIMQFDRKLVYRWSFLVWCGVLISWGLLRGLLK